MVRVPLEHLERFVASCLASLGFTPGDAAYMARVMVDTEARGVTTHGLSQLDNLRSHVGGLVDPSARPVVRSHTAGAVVLDGNRCAAILCMREAKEMARERADTIGIAWVSVIDTTWIAAPGPHLVDLARDGYLAAVYVHNTRWPAAAPFGGMDARLSTNPLALAIPRRGEPIVADFSTSTISFGRARTMATAGELVEQPRFIDSEGRLSRDPQTVFDGGAMLGAGGEAEGYKGYALSLWHEALTAAAGGSPHDPDGESRQSYHLLLIAPEVLSDQEHYLKEMERFVAHLKTSRPRPGVKEILLPGERSAAALREAREQGIELDDERIAALRQTAEKLGMDPGEWSFL